MHRNLGATRSIVFSAPIKGAQLKRFDAEKHQAADYLRQELGIMTEHFLDRFALREEYTEELTCSAALIF